MRNHLPEGTKLNVLHHAGRKVIQVQLPENSPPLNRKQKQQIKALVRKQVKEEKLKEKNRIIQQEKNHAQNDA